MMKKAYYFGILIVCIIILLVICWFGSNYISESMSLSSGSLLNIKAKKSVNFASNTEYILFEKNDPPIKLRSNENDYVVIPPSGKKQ